MFLCLAPIFCSASLIRAAEPKPETVAAFDRYIKVTEAAMDQRQGTNFLWLDQNRKQKTLVWMGQTIIEPHQALDQGQAIEIPEGELQDSIGWLFLEGATMERVRDMILNFADYKTYFKDQIIDSKQVSRDGNHFESFLRFYKRQVTPIILNVKQSVLYTAYDPADWTIVFRSSHIGEVAHPLKKRTYDEERPPEDSAGYLWRLNFYWRLHSSDGGVYAELETISLARPSGGLHPGRFLSGYEALPHEVEEGVLDGVRKAFPLLH